MKNLLKDFKHLSLWSMMLFISFVINSCDENNNSTKESVNKTGTYTEKADLNEVINKIGNRDLKLIELIKNNPVSMIKAASYQKTKSSSEYYFDTDNIRALKNETNQAVYIIPAYKSSNARDSNIYSISINITDDFIDTKLNILQLKADGTQEYISRNFVYSSSTSKTSKVKDIECYCTIYITGGISQATGWDMPEEIYMECGGCSGVTSSGGSSSGSDFGTTSGSNTGSTVISNVWASSGGGSSNYGYAYITNGQKAYIELSKRFRLDDLTQYNFTQFQQVAITSNLEISKDLIEFLDTDGKTQSNKNFVISILDGIEAGTVNSYEEFRVLLNAYKYIKYNRTASDTDTGDIDNNSIGGYDNTLYSDFNPQQSPWPNVSSIIPVSQFIGFGAEGIRRNCMDYAKAQIAKMGYKISNYNDIGQTFKIYNEQTGVNRTELPKGLSYLKYAISKGIPVIVGVDDAPGVPLNSNGTPGNPDLTTDHFIVIVGMGTNSQGNYFQFYDNASGYPSQGANSLNLLYYNHTNGTISGQSQTSYAQSPGLHNYIITQIRKSKLL